MSGDTVECFNCGHQNPSWAQVCRSCGYPIQPMAPSSGAPRGLFPTDQASLISIGGALGAILAAIVLGLILSGVIPPAPNVAVETPIPTPSPSVSASPSQLPSTSAGPSTSGVPTVQLPGTITFGTDWDNAAKEIIGATTTFTAASSGFAHSISLSEPFGVDRLQEEVVRVAGDGTETVVQPREDGTVFVNPELLTDGLKSDSSVSEIIAGWGKGTFIMRIYRGEEQLAEGSFTLA
jgi:hypothetical protein